MKHRRDRETPDDAQWIRDALAQYEGPLTLYAAKLVGDVERARDIVQDTFLKLWTAERDKVDGHLAQWLYRVCRNRALDVRRKEVRMTTMQKEHLEVHEAPPPQANHEGAEQSPKVMAAVETLTDKQQEAIRLKFQGGLSYQEIAEVMEITANHVGVLIHTALKNVREKLRCSELNSPGIGARTLR